MKKPQVIAVTLVGSLVAVAGAIVLWPVTWLLFFYGCGAAEKQLSTAIASLPILHARLAGADPQGEPYKGCENDDMVPYAEQTYRFSGTWGEVEAFYREAAMKDGWKFYPESVEPEMLCFTRSADDHEFELLVELGPSGERANEYTVTASSGSGGWLCTPPP
jgi:hypothetical protein